MNTTKSIRRLKVLTYGSALICIFVLAALALDIGLALVLRSESPSQAWYFPYSLLLLPLLLIAVPGYMIGRRRLRKGHSKMRSQ